MDEMSTMSNTTRPPLNLLDLPRELLDIIFKDAWDDGVPDAPPCKDFELIWLRHRWLRLDISSFHYVERLRQALPILHSRLRLVLTLKFGQDALQNECELDKFRVVDSLLRLLSCMPQLRVLEIADADALSGVFLTSPLLEYTDEVRFLSISDALTDEQSPPSGEPAHRRFCLANVQSLHIGEYSASQRVNQLIKLSPRLRHLALFRPLVDNVDEALDSLSNPSILEELVFHTDCDGLVDLLARVLPSLTSLVELHIEDSPFHDLPDPLLLALQKGSIADIILDSTGIKPSELVPLLSSSRQMSSLRRLQLSGVWGGDEGEERDLWEPVRGLSAEAAGLDLNAFLASWKLADWGELAERAEEVVELATRNGIQVEGSIMDGVAAEKEYREELAKLKVMIRDAAGVTTA